MKKGFWGIVGVVGIASYLVLSKRKIALRYFRLSEFDSKDSNGSGKGTGALMNEAFLLMIDAARHNAGFAFIISSGFRTYLHNLAVGGKLNSSHLTGFAADVKYTSVSQAISIVISAQIAGFKRIGIGNGFIHLDNDPRKPNAIWVYDDTPAYLKTWVKAI